MRGLLSVLPNIVDFEYQFYGIHEEEARYDFLMLIRDPSFGQGLEPLRERLQTLRRSIEIIPLADVMLYCQDHSARIDTESCLSVLRHFKALKTLEIPLVVLLGWMPRPEHTLLHVLPSTLEYLRSTTLCVHICTISGVRRTSCYASANTLPVTGQPT
jgi:hypothetical protein